MVVVCMGIHQNTWRGDGACGAQGTDDRSASREARSGRRKEDGKGGGGFGYLRMSCLGGNSGLGGLTREVA